MPDPPDVDAERIPPAPRSTHVVDGLAVQRRRPQRAAAIVVLVHGAMDRADSFGRTMRRLGDIDVVAYDRRGYAGSALTPAGEPTGGGTSGNRALGGHVSDLLAVCRWASADHPGAPLTVVGHSLGGLIALLAAVRTPAGTVGPGWSAPGEGPPLASVAAFEAPMPWDPSADGTRPGDAALAVARRDGPPAAAEFFYRAMVGDAVWNRLPERSRAARRSEGTALVAELEGSRTPAARPDPTSVDVPVHVACGGRSPAQMAAVAARWADAFRVPLEEISRAGHGAHLSHPDEFARWVRAASTASPEGVG